MSLWHEFFMVNRMIVSFVYGQVFVVRGLEIFEMEVDRCLEEMERVQIW